MLRVEEERAAEETKWRQSFAFRWKGTWGSFPGNFNLIVPYFRQLITLPELGAYAQEGQVQFHN